MQYSKLSSATVMADVLSSAGRSSSQTLELTLAAAEVVFRRVTLGGFAMVDPGGADYAEFARMVPEKTRAFSDAGSILVSQSAQIGWEMTRFIADEVTLAAETATEILANPNPARMLATQADAGMSWAARLAALPHAMCRLALEAQAATMAPIHHVAADNVERLRNGGVTL